MAPSDTATATENNPEISHDEATALEAVEAKAEELSEAADLLTEGDAQAATTDELAAAERALKAAENALEEARKETVEAELDDRVEVGESVEGLARTEGHRKYINDEEAAVEKLADAGVEREEVTEVKPSLVAEKAEENGVDPDEVVEKYTYTYYRRE